MGDYGNLIFTVECKKSLKVVHTVIIHSAVYLRYHPDAPKVRVITRANLDKCPDYRHKQITLDRF